MVGFVAGLKGPSKSVVHQSATNPPASSGRFGGFGAGGYFWTIVRAAGCGTTARSASRSTMWVELVALRQVAPRPAAQPMGETLRSGRVHKPNRPLVSGLVLSQRDKTHPILLARGSGAGGHDNYKLTSAIL